MTLAIFLLLGAIGIGIHDHQEQRQITELAITDIHSEDDHRLCQQYRECREVKKCQIFEAWEDQCNILAYYDTKDSK